MVRAHIHIDVDSLIRDNLKRTGLRAEVSVDVTFRVQDIIAGWKLKTIVSLIIGEHPRNFVFPVLTQDDQRIFGIVHRLTFRRARFGDLNRLGHEDF